MMNKWTKKWNMTFPLFNPPLKPMSHHLNKRKSLCKPRLSKINKQARDLISKMMLTLRMP